MIYRLVRKLDKAGWLVEDFNDDNVLAAMEIRGLPLAGFEGNPRLRPELQGQPKFSGVLGPMWGGMSDDGEDIVVRYENANAYNILSS